MIVKVIIWDIYIYIKTCRLVGSQWLILHIGLCWHVGLLSASRLIDVLACIGCRTGKLGAVSPQILPTV